MTSSPVWRSVVTVLVSLVSAPAAFLLAFFGLLTWSGCFLECRTSQPDHAGGMLLYIAAALMLFAGPLLAHFLAHSRRLLLGTLAVPGLVAGYFLLLLVG